jgi:hypothetical protein
MIDTDSDIGPYKPYRARSIAFHGVRHDRDWKTKVYSVAEAGCKLEWDAFVPGIRAAFAALPEPVRAPGRPGLALLIAHEARLASYLVLGWWDRENELPVRVFLRPTGESAWRPAVSGESFCVWDLEILWYERQSYVETMLQGADPRSAIKLYLARHLPSVVPTERPMLTAPQTE